jgi:hypothetical protein
MASSVNESQGGTGRVGALHGIFIFVTGLTSVTENGKKKETIGA